MFAYYLLQSHKSFETNLTKEKIPLHGFRHRSRICKFIKHTLWACRYASVQCTPCFRGRIVSECVPSVCACKVYKCVYVCVSTCVQLLFERRKNLHIAFYVCHAFAFRTVLIASEDRTELKFSDEILSKQKNKIDSAFFIFWFWFTSSIFMVKFVGHLYRVQANEISPPINSTSHVDNMTWSDVVWFFLFSASFFLHHLYIIIYEQYTVRHTN